MSRLAHHQCVYDLRRTSSQTPIGVGFVDDDEVIDEEFEEEESAGDPEDPDFDDEDLDGDLVEEDDDLDGEAIVGEDDEEEDDEPVVPATRARPGAATGEDDDEDEDPDPDDVEADLDTILKDRIASGDDSDEDEEEEVALDRNDPELADGVIHKREGEFTCTGCFMIVHPRQFGRKGNLVCPVGDEDCPAISIVAAQLG